MRQLRERIQRDRRNVTKECVIGDEVLAFFQRIVTTRIEGTTLTPCEMIGLTLLRRCVPRTEVKYHVFRQTLGMGLNGFVFECLYRNREPRAVKLVLIRDPRLAPSVRLDRHVIRRMAESMVRKEFEMHLRVRSAADDSAPFRVLNVIGRLSVFKPRRLGWRVAVYVMDKLPGPTLANEMYSPTTTRTYVVSKLRRSSRHPRRFSRTGLCAHGLSPREHRLHGR
jgi:hypothetical protein